ncbi:MAG: hypothetical protein QHH07_10500 [Sedimentisphaerales bacterium]|nr:hypothetical protein [Sedimentisphaerales bacterium]
MVFWLAVLVGLICAVIGANAGLHQMTALLVNLLVGAYMAVFMTGFLIQAVPAALEIPYGGLLAAVVIGIGTILVLQGLYIALFPAASKISFPRAIDVLVGGGMGFLTGFLAIALICTLVYATVDLKGIPFVSEQSIQTHCRYVCWWTDQIHRLVR